MSNRVFWARGVAVVCVTTLLTPSFGAMLTWDRYKQRFEGRTVRVKDVEGIRDLVQNGKLYLRLKDFLTLVLKNNTDVLLTELDVMNAEDAVLAAHAPFDPAVTLGLVTTRNKSPEFTQTSGASELNTLSHQAQIGVQQTLSTGQTFGINFNGARTSTNNAFQYFNPSILTGLGFNFTQPLLQNRSSIQLRAPLQIAKAQLLIASDQSETRIADLVANAARQYWDAVAARDNIRVQQLSVDLAQKSYDRDKLALELGALSPLEIFQSQSQLAERKVGVIQAQSAYRDTLDGLRRLIGADLDPSTRSIEVILDDDPSTLPPLPPSLDAEEAITAALEHRPELSAVRRRYLIEELNARVARNLLLPRLDLGLQFGGLGLGGNQVPISGPLGTGPTTFIPGGLGDALHQLFLFDAPYYGFSFQMTLPIRSSAAEAALADARVNRARDQYQERQLKQQIIQEVKIALNQLATAHEQIEASKVARELAQKNVDAQQQKYDVGGITAFELLDAQNRLAALEGSLVSAYTGYQKALILYKRSMWTLLDDFGMVVKTVKTP